MEALEDLLRQRDATIAELERLNAEKDVQISELLSQLDKYKSVLFAGAPAPHTGLFVAPSAIPVSRKQHRAWGISAEPPSSHSSPSGNTLCASQPCQKFYKDQGSVHRLSSLTTSCLFSPQTAIFIVNIYHENNFYCKLITKVEFAELILAVFTARSN